MAADERLKSWEFSAAFGAAICSLSRVSGAATLFNQGEDCFTNLQSISFCRATDIIALSLEGAGRRFVPRDLIS